MVNRVILIGNLGRDPEVRRLENGAVVAKFSIATNESYKDKSGEWQTITEWHDVVVWRQLAERAERDLKKGKLVYIEGKLTHRKYTDKDNIERYTTEVVANSLRLLEKRESSGGSFGANMPSAEPTAMAANPSTTSTSTPSSTPAATGNTADDDLPF